MTNRSWARLGAWWNWKCALLSTAIRGVLFFATNLPAGLHAAELALATDITFRALLAGTFGALIQALATWRRRRLATAITMIAIPVASHGVEWLVHWRAGTALLTLSVVASVSLTLVTTAFDLFAMRRHTLVTGAGGESFWQDLRRLPVLIASFLAAPVRLVAGRLGAPATRHPESRRP